MSIALTPDCKCGRGAECGLVKGRLDAEDYAKIWLPVGYMNSIRDSTFLEMSKKQSEFEFPDRKEAVKTYLADMKKGRSRYHAALTGAK